MDLPQILKYKLGLGFLALIFITQSESNCNRGCDLALASYYVWRGSNLTFISTSLSTTIPHILKFNPQITNPDYIIAGSRINVPFPCDCLNRDFLGHQFVLFTKSGATYRKVAETYFSNLVTVESLRRINSYSLDFVSSADVKFNVILNCSCGDATVSRDYGLFVTYPLRDGESLVSVAVSSGLPLNIIQSYNPNVNSGIGGELIVIPGKDPTGNYPTLKSSNTGLSHEIIASIISAVTAGFLLLALCLYVVRNKWKAMQKESSVLQAASKDQYFQLGHGTGNSFKKTSALDNGVDATAPSYKGFSVNKSIEFSYEELAKATNDFNIVNKIGQGGFGSVYYAELRGERAAIKKMDMQASKEFLAELKVLTHVHHLNLVRLIGYCIEGSLFVVYEFIENGNLSQHLRGKGRGILPWSTRVQIALDSARGLEYIHEHTVPVYIHRDIKSANILVDKNFHAKVADFGLAKLSEIGDASRNTRLVGTFGYMPPEYAKFGDISAKVDVYAFGVVLYELISANEAIVKIDGSITNTKGLVSLFEDCFSKPNSIEDLCKLVDPRIANDYPLDAVHKMAQLGRACTDEKPQLRPSMRSVVVALMTLSSTEVWDTGMLYENQHTSSDPSVDY